MRILWISHDVLPPFFPFVEGKPTRGGSWIDPLFFSLATIKNIEIGIISPVLDGKYQTKKIERISYYAVPINKGDTTKFLTKDMSAFYIEAINDFKPDIIHVHGIEKNFGQLREYVDYKIPIVCSIQGVITSYLPYLKVSIAGYSIKKFKSIKNLIGRGGVDANIRNWAKYMPVEQHISIINNYFIGRTDWDKAQLKTLNPDAKYFHGEELLREDFYKNEWNLDTCKRHQIFVSSAAYPVKGFHVVLKAISLLKKKYPDIKLISPLSSININSSFIWDFLFGEDYGRYLKHEIFRLGLQDNIQMLNRMSADEMAKCFINANVFVLPSFVENSPNSLGEAMMIGVPTVVSPVGGVMSIVVDNESSLIFPSGDYAYLASQIDRIFSDDKLACKLSIKSKSIAKIRHDTNKVTKQYLEIYKQIIELHIENYTS